MSIVRRASLTSPMQREGVACGRPLRSLAGEGLVVLLCAALMMLSVGKVAHAVVIIGSSAGNTSAPTDPDLAVRWNQVGNFGSFMGTPIASQFFVTAEHIGNLTGQSITFLDASSYTTTARFTDPNSDLAIYQISGTFPSDKIVPMYAGGFTTNQAMTIFGRGRSRTDTAIVGERFPTGTEDKGWTWGSFTGNRSWGTNTLDGISDQGAAGLQLAYQFDQGGGSNEGILSTNDSGGPVFMVESGEVRLAGINYAVGPVNVRESATGPTLTGSLYDYGGLYLNDGSGNWVLEPATINPKPAFSLSTSIPAQSAWISSVITVPEPATWTLLVGCGVSGAFCLLRRRRGIRRGVRGAAAVVSRREVAGGADHAAPAEVLSGAPACRGSRGG